MENLFDYASRDERLNPLGRNDMLKRIPAALLTLVFILSLFGCNQEKDMTEEPVQTPLPVEEKNEYEELYIEALSEIDKLNNTVDEKDVEIDRLKNENRELVKQVAGQTDTIAVSSAFEWTGNGEWDEMRITQYYPDYDAENMETTVVSITEGNMLNIMPNFIFPKLLEYGQPVDPGDGGKYRYEFIKGSNTYMVDVYDSRYILYEGAFYYCMCGLYLNSVLDFGNAFIADKDEVNFTHAKDYPGFIYDSPICAGEKIYTSPLISKNRNQTLAKALSELTITSKPENIDEISDENLIESLTFYNNGKTLVLNVYVHYVNIEYDGRDTWLAKYENDQVQPVEYLLHIYGAN